MKVIYEKAIEVNNDHELNIDEQQDDINYFFFCIDYKDEVQDITAYKNCMKNIKAVYVTCHHTFAMQNGLKKHVQEEHTELWQIVAKCSEIERK